jgi:hypothetical protein
MLQFRIPGMGRANFTHQGIDRLNGEVNTYLTMGVEQPVYADRTPAPLELEDLAPSEEDDFPISTHDIPFGDFSTLDMHLNVAIWETNDPRIWADVYRLRSADIYIRNQREREVHITRMEQFVLHERREFEAAKSRNLARRQEAVRRLHDAHALTKVLRILEGIESEEDHARRVEYIINERWARPVLRAGAGPTDRYDPFERPARARRNARWNAALCDLCRTPGHLANACDTPHYHCSRAYAGYCLIRPTHAHYRGTRPLREECPYHGRQPGERQLVQAAIIRRENRQEAQMIQRTARDNLNEEQDQGTTLYEDYGEDM